ncbi:lysophospholipid acyltransferase family protein [Mucilaginibacter agri]|uniref:Lauroyl acyltransferase n=1 Tax=Mucilaginibacter agri TaxID=2695265 RepID=A0A966DUP6_9SPHI|nr:lysophospholipid acyltransferase family protein [Mucilaginibacter agri]NCD71980.1 lauroyl acyltransferase [Mucilaginibacter agri]
MIKKGLTSLAVFFLYLISLLPFWLLYLIADFLYVIMYYVTGYRRGVVQQNLKNSFPEKNAEELHAIEKKYYHYLADLFVETIKSITISKTEMEKRMYLTNLEVINGYFAQNRSIIAVVGHYGNWEWGALRTGTMTHHRRVIIYKPLNNKTSDQLFKRMREKFGATLIPMKSTLRKMAELKSELSLSVFASDQTPVREEAHYFTPFLNQPTAVFLGIEKIATLFNSVVVFADIRRVKRGYYECTFVPLVEEPKQTKQYEITQAHVQYLEKVIKEEPAYWLWSHRRWKFKPEGN